MRFEKTNQETKSGAEGEGFRRREIFLAGIVKKKECEIKKIQDDIQWQL